MHLYLYLFQQAKDPSHHQRTMTLKQPVLFHPRDRPDLSPRLATTVIPNNHTLPALNPMKRENKMVITTQTIDSHCHHLQKTDHSLRRIESLVPHLPPSTTTRTITRHQMTTQGVTQLHPSHPLALLQTMLIVLTKKRRMELTMPTR
uniref:Uncharacterized protein n=1 Tax=Cacopsylla melanoneura TaxID=428564 RepID=A0A8D8LK68_9HEMI